MSEKRNPDVGLEQVDCEPALTTADKTERNWAMFCHLSAFAALLAIPMGNILAPLVIWLMKKDTMPVVEREGRKALNFQISMTIYGLAAGLLIFAAVGIVLLPVVALVAFILTIVASVKASNGETYKYPFVIEFIK